MNILIVHGYWYANYEDVFWKKYFEWIQKIIIEYSITHIVWSGGYTADSTRSEAKSMLTYYHDQYGLEWPMHLIEDRSETTLENIIYSQTLLEKQNSTIQTIHTLWTNAHCYKSFYLLLKYSAWLWEEEVFRVLLEQRWRFNFDESAKDITFEYENFFTHGVDVWLPVQKFAHQIAWSMMTMWFERYPKIHEQFKAIRKKNRRE
jgi:hypothetical protein